MLIVSISPTLNLAFLRGSYFDQTTSPPSSRVDQRDATSVKVKFTGKSTISPQG
jgi:hypothetical protein